MTSKLELNLFRLPWWSHDLSETKLSFAKNDFLNGAEPPNRLHENIHSKRVNQKHGYELI